MSEDKTSIEKLANMNLEGLFLPEVSPVSFWWLWLLLGLLLIVIIWRWVKNYNSHKSIALRALKKLQKDSSDTEAREIEKKIIQTLRQGFNVTRLDQVMPDDPKWNEYLTTLEDAVYSKEQNKPQKLSLLINNAQMWLRNN